MSEMIVIPSMSAPIRNKSRDYRKKEVEFPENANKNKDEEKTKPTKIIRYRYRQKTGITAVRFREFSYIRYAGAAVF